MDTQSTRQPGVEDLRQLAGAHLQNPDGPRPRDRGRHELPGGGSEEYGRAVARSGARAGRRAIAAVAILGCGGGRTIGDGRHDPRVDAGPPAPLQPAAPFEWAPTAFDEPCTERGCGRPYRLVIEFKDEAELTAAGWRRATGASVGPVFAGGVWTAPAGTYDEWLHGPTEWGRLATRTQGWAITAKVEVHQGKATCAPNVRGPGLRVSGDLGSAAVTLLPRGLELAGQTTSLPPGTPYTIRIEGRDQGITILVNGSQVLSGAGSEPGYSAPSAIEFGQLGCSNYESRWDQLVVEANIFPCSVCLPGEHPMIAAVRQHVPGRAVDTGHTATAYPRCLAHAAIDYAIRTVLVEELVAARQRDRAIELSRLDPLSDAHRVELAFRVLDPMGAPPPFQGCDPVRSADECNVAAPAMPEPVPAIVEFARREFPNTGWTDYAASGPEAMHLAAIAIIQRAGAQAMRRLLQHLTALASPGELCAPAAARAPLEQAH